MVRVWVGLVLFCAWISWLVVDDFRSGSLRMCGVLDLVLAFWLDLVFFALYGRWVWWAVFAPAFCELGGVSDLVFAFGWFCCSGVLV